MALDEKDYSNAGATEDVDTSIDTEDQLNDYLGEKNEDGTEPSTSTVEELEEIANKEGATDEQKLAAFEARTLVDSKDEKPDDGKGGDDKPPVKPELDENGKPIVVEEEEEFNNTLEFLNKEHTLGLNLTEMPKDMTREQEAKAISGIIGRMVNGVNNQMSQYEDIKTILADSEVASFIKAKAEGKTMVDFVQQYAGTTEGMGNEALATDELRVKNPHLSDDDIAAQVTSLKDRDKLDDFATKIRGERETLAAEKVETNKNAVALQTQEAETKRLAEVEDFNKFITDKNDLYGIPLNAEMKKQLFGAATQIDKDGETYLEKALQSNEGVLLATAGLLHMERLMKGYAALDVNQRKKSFMDTLFDSPDALQSSTSEHEKKGFDVDAANQF